MTQSFIPFILKVIIGGLGGAVLHELVHFVPWWLGGRRPELDIRGLEVRPTAGVDNLLMTWEVQPLDQFAAGLPLAIGIGSIPIILTYPSIPFILGWLMFTIGGDTSDWETLLTPVFENRERGYPS